MNKLLRSTAAWVIAIAAFHCLIPPGAMVAKAENLDLSLNGIYNDSEERGSFDMIMQPYPIPVKTTTYVNFVFNLPENTPDLFHVVFGEVINSQPLHLHHFVLTGCTRTFDASQEGVPMNDGRFDGDCAIQLGGWAPGAEVFGNVDMEVGVLMGRMLGYQAVRLNVHYTSGVYEDEDNQIFKMATDGIRVHYTSNFRPYTSMSKAVLSVGFGPRDLVIPPNQSRFYITRTCKVQSTCTDAQDELQNVLEISGSAILDFLPPGTTLSDITCPNAKPFCGVDGEIGQLARRFCPASCGFCEKVKENGEANPFNPDSYRMTAINYHAHLLGREMYTTLLREGTGNDGKIEIDAIDLESKQLWIFDNQGVYPFAFEDKDASNLRGLDIVPGDKIQVTCIYNSEERTEDTRFGLSTFDEMCITTAYVTFETPTSLMTNNGSNNETTVASNEIALDLITELNFMTFRCETDDESSVHTGVLEADEDARDIWKDHPIEDSEGCIFPVTEGVPGATFDGGVLFSSDCSSNNIDDEEATFCNPGSTLMPDIIVGYTCINGTLDGKDANEGVKESDCVEGGGEFQPYNCDGLNYYFLNLAESDGLSKEEISGAIFFFQPKCCEVAEVPVTDGPDLPSTGEDPKDEVPKDEVPKDEESKEEDPKEDKPDPKESMDDSAAATPWFETSSVVLALGLFLYHSACTW